VRENERGDIVSVVREDARRSERPSSRWANAKPLRPERLDEFCTSIMLDPAYLVSYVDLYAEVKYDGFSVTVEITPDEEVLIYNRTVKAREAHREPLLILPDARKYFTQFGIDVRPRLVGELRAVFEGVEAGYVEVLAMRNVFVENKLQNEGPFELKLTLFGLVSTSPRGLTEKSAQDMPNSLVRLLLKKMVIPSNPLVEVAEAIRMRAVCTFDEDGAMVMAFDRLADAGDGVYYRVATGAGELRAYLLREADRRQIEGFVLKKDKDFRVPNEAIERRYTGEDRILRDPSMVKVKREFDLQLVACRVALGTVGRVQEKMIWLYRKITIPGAFLDDEERVPWQRLAFAGDATKHAIIPSYFREVDLAFFYTTPEEKANLMELPGILLDTEPKRFVQFEARCTNFSKTHYHPIGVKNTTRRTALSLERLTDTEAMAGRHPHFVSTKRASDRMAEALERKAKSAPRKRKAQKSPPPSPELRADYPVTPRSPSPVKPRSPSPVVEPVKPRSPSPVVEPVKPQAASSGLPPVPARWAAQADVMESLDITQDSPTLGPLPPVPARWAPPQDLLEDGTTRALPPVPARWRFRGYALDPLADL